MISIQMNKKSKHKDPNQQKNMKTDTQGSK